MKQKLYIIRKMVMAKSAKEAIEKEKKQEVDEVWMDEEWKSKQIEKDEPLGF